MNDLRKLRVQRGMLTQSIPKTLEMHCEHIGNALNALTSIELINELIEIN
jgi:hypothetical protein